MYLFSPLGIFPEGFSLYISLMNTESVSTLSRLGLMDPIAAIESIVNGMQPADLTRLRYKLSTMVENRIADIKRKVKRTRLKELEAWHLQLGDREIVAQHQRARVWRVYEAKRTKSGEFKKGRLLEARTGIDGLNDVVWDLAIGKY
jgi:hypothetical protein